MRVIFIGTSPDHECLSESALSSVFHTHPSSAKRYDLKPEIEREIRKYQWELALPGLSGQNYIVCAPTGSGKTRVAGLVIAEHLKSKKGRGKVLFVVNKVPLVQQQRAALEAMIHGAKMTEVSGDMAPHKKALLAASLHEGLPASSGHPALLALLIVPVLQVIPAL